MNLRSTRVVKRSEACIDQAAGQSERARQHVGLVSLVLRHSKGV